MVYNKIKSILHRWSTKFVESNVTRYLKNVLKTVVGHNIQRDGYFGQPEIKILSNVTDNKQPIRKLVLRSILRARREKKKEIRLYNIPSFNFDATNVSILLIGRNVF